MQSDSGLIELRTLGGLDLRTADGALVQSVLAQPRRAAILIYLALARPHGRHHQRDTLVGLFWPERDDEHARKALRQSLYYLRTSLGGDVIVSIGDGDVGIQPGSIRCDVAELDRAIHEGRPADALALYQGDLLPGFYVDDAPDFERWLELEREWVRTRAAEAAWQLADAQLAAGDAPAAAEAAKRAAALAPLDETGARRLMDLLERCGDSAAAVRAFEAFAWRLEQEYELEPSPETRALAQAIRARSAAPLPPAALPVTPPAAAHVAPIMMDVAAPAATGEEPVHVPRPLRILRELRRRRVFRVAAAYSVAAFVMMQVVDVVFPALLMPDWVSRLVIFLLILGFPIALSLAWAFEVTPDGQLRWETASATLPAGQVQPRARWLAAAVVAFLLLATSTVGAVKWPALRDTVAVWRAPPLDSTRYVVFPFDRDSAAPAELRETELLHDALARWTGISVAHPVDMRDALATRDAGRLTAAEARALAASLGARHYVLGGVTRLPGVLRVHAAVYDASSSDGLPALRSSIDLPHALHASPDSAFAVLASALLFPCAASPECRSPGTLHLSARRAYEDARAALHQWDAVRADSLFTAATMIDPAFTRAWLELAQLRMWTGRGPAEWRGAAERAAAADMRLHPREELLSAAMLHMARGEYPHACDVFQAVITRDPSDFAGLMGLAECQRRDNVVVPAPQAPSGWRYRASYHQALLSLERAFTIEPSALRLFEANSYQKLREHFFTGAQQLRRGSVASGDGAIIFTARPSFAGDTVAFHPAQTHSLSPEHARVVRRLRERFRDVVMAAARRRPGTADALEAVAAALELTGDPAALDTVRRARAVAASDEQRLRLAASEVWLNVKLGLPDDTARLIRARTLADSVLDHMPATPVADGMLASIAALVGRAEDAANISVRLTAASAEGRRAPAVAAPAARLLAAAALGLPADTLRTLASAVRDAIDATVPPADRPAAVQWAFGWAAGLAIASFSDAGDWIPTDSDYLLRAHSALLMGDTLSMITVLDSIAALRRYSLPGDISIDGAFGEAALLHRAGEHRRAIALLRAPLDALRFAPPQAHADLVRAASLIRAINLHAELAAAAGDRRLTRRWARASSILWQDADEILAPTVRRMRSLLASAPQ